MSLASQVTLLAQRVALEIKAVRAELASASGGVYVDEDEPPSPVNGQLWYDPDDTSSLVIPVPVGALFPFAGFDAPSGYLKCQGQDLSTIDYPDLFTVVGYEYGGSGTTFKLPDLRSRMPVGQANPGVALDPRFGVLGTTGGEPEHQLTEAEMPSHNHTFTTWGHPQPISATGGAFVRHTATSSIITYSIDTNSKGSDLAHENMPPFIVLHYIIKV